MSAEIRIQVTVSLGDDPTATAAPAKTVLLAWEAFTTAIKGTTVIANDFYLGPGKQRRRRRAGRPGLSGATRLTVAEPPSAA